MLFEHSLLVSCTSVERDWSAANPFYSCAETALQDPTGPSSEARQANTYCGTVHTSLPVPGHTLPVSIM